MIPKNWMPVSVKIMVITLRLGYACMQKTEPVRLKAPFTIFKLQGHNGGGGGLWRWR